MRDKEHSFFIAYIICLCVSLLAKLITIIIPAIHFDMWSKIVVAATVSTVYFCLADVACMRKDMETFTDLCMTPIRIKRIKLEKRLEMPEGDTPGFKEEIVKQYINELREDIRELVKPIEDKQEKKSGITFALNMCGFCVFLLILLFDFLYKLFYPFQDIMTIIAFIVVLISVSYRETKMSKLNAEIQLLDMELDKHSLALALTELDECFEGVRNDGKAEDADK